MFLCSMKINRILEFFKRNKAYSLVFWAAITDMQGTKADQKRWKTVLNEDMQLLVCSLDVALKKQLNNSPSKT